MNRFNAALKAQGLHARRWPSAEGRLFAVYEQQGDQFVGCVSFDDVGVCRADTNGACRTQRATLEALVQAVSA